MKNRCKNISEEDVVINEPQIKASDLLAEIMLLLEDYFVGDISLQDNGIYYSLPNGQKFILSACLSA